MSVRMNKWMERTYNKRNKRERNDKIQIILPEFYSYWPHAAHEIMCIAFIIQNFFFQQQKQLQ